MPDDAWSPAQIDMLKGLLACRPKLSARDIAATLNSKFRGRSNGHSFTRNSVIAKTHRQGWQTAGTVTPQRKIKIKKKRKPPKPKPKLLPPVSEPKPLPATPLRDKNIPQAQRCSIYQLGTTSCRWPVGIPTEPGFFFCGGEVVAERPYCAGHCVLAYTFTRNFVGPAKAQRLSPAVFKKFDAECEGERSDDDGECDPDEGAARGAEGDAQRDADQNLFGERDHGLEATTMPTPATDQ